MNMYKIIIVFILYHLYYFVPYSCVPLIAGTEPHFLQEMEASLAKIINDYVELEQKKLTFLSEHSKKLEKRSKSHKVSEQNPIWLYRQVESMIEEWKTIQEAMNSTSLPAVLMSQPARPHLLHLTEIATAIYRIQDVYAFSARDLASGSLVGLDNAGTMDARDCFNLGAIAFSKEDYYHALFWLQEANIRLPQESESKITPTQIAPLLVLALNRTGNRERAVGLALDMLKNEKNEKVREMWALFPDLKTLMKEGKRDKKSGSSKELPPLKNERNIEPDLVNVFNQTSYEALCRRGYEKQYHASLVNSKLTCYFVKNSPYSMLVPIKKETLSLSPSVAIFRQIISDKEIDQIKQLAKDKLFRSQVAEIGASSHVVRNNVRESYTAWLWDVDHSVIERVRRRVGLSTGLSMESAEALQVTEYGIGGHYGPHFDHSTNEERINPNYTGAWNRLEGDRIATMMFYLVEPEHGGGTAFPRANLVVKPSKNDAIFWYNIKASGKQDDQTLHAGCPVVSGSKWVANEWIHENGQEFRRRCGLFETD